MPPRDNDVSNRWIRNWRFLDVIEVMRAEILRCPDHFPAFHNPFPKIFSCDSRLYKRMCPLVRPWVCPSFRPLVRHAFFFGRPKLRQRTVRTTRRAEIRRLTTYFVYTNLLDASSHLYVRVCPSIGPFVGPSVSPSIGWPICLSVHL